MPMRDKFSSALQITSQERSALHAARVSMGIVTVMENNMWGTLNKNNSNHRVTHQQANSICRHLGFTGAGTHSARTVSSYSEVYNFTNYQLG